VPNRAYDAGTYYLNPYRYRVNLVDCRSQRFNLAEDSEMGFASKDGFWVSLDGIIEFRVKPERAAEVFVVYNESQSGRRRARQSMKRSCARSSCQRAIVLSLAGLQSFGPGFHWRGNANCLPKRFLRRHAQSVRPGGS